MMSYSICLGQLMNTHTHYYISFFFLGFLSIIYIWVFPPPESHQILLYLFLFTPLYSCLLRLVCAHLFQTQFANGFLVDSFGSDFGFGLISEYLSSARTNKRTTTMLLAFELYIYIYFFLFCCIFMCVCVWVMAAALLFLLAL